MNDDTCVSVVCGYCDQEIAARVNDRLALIALRYHLQSGDCTARPVCRWCGCAHSHAAQCATF